MPGVQGEGWTDEEWAEKMLGRAEGAMPCQSGSNRGGKLPGHRAAGSSAGIYGFTDTAVLGAMVQRRGGGQGSGGSGSCGLEGMAGRSIDGQMHARGGASKARANQATGREPLQANQYSSAKCVIVRWVGQHCRSGQAAAAVSCCVMDGWLAPADRTPRGRMAGVKPSRL